MQSGTIYIVLLHLRFPLHMQSFESPLHIVLFFQ